MRVAALVGVLLLGAACSNTTPDAGAISSVIRGAETAKLNFADPPAGYAGGYAPPQMLQTMLDRVNAELSLYYTGVLLDSEIETYRGEVTVVMSAGQGFREGGVSSLSLGSVSEDSGGATTAATVGVWFTTAQSWTVLRPTPPVARNTLALDVHLVRTRGGWRIDRETEGFAPGGGP